MRVKGAIGLGSSEKGAERTEAGLLRVNCEARTDESGKVNSVRYGL